MAPEEKQWAEYMKKMKLKDSDYFRYGTKYERLIKKTILNS